MAQTGFTPIALYYSATGGNTPTSGNLVAGELAINTADGKLFYKDSAGVVQVIAGKGGAGVAGGSNTQVQYNSSGSLAGSANMTFSGTALTLANDASISGLTVGKGGGAATGNTALGASSLATNSSGTYNTATGLSSLTGNTTGVNNSAFGVGAMQTNTTGGSNTALGMQSLASNTTASNNTAVGYQSLYSTTYGDNTAVGYQSGYSNNTGIRNFFGGWQAGYSATGSFVTAIGYQAGYSNTEASNGNVFIGYFSGRSNTSGGANAALGVSSLYGNTTGSNNIAFGQGALTSNTTAYNNTAVGYQAGYSNTTGAESTFVGSQAGFAVTTGAQEACFGVKAGYSLTTGWGNVLIGTAVGYSLTTGSGNTFIGGADGRNRVPAGYYVTTGSNNTIIGAYGGNEGGLDIRTASNYIVLSDGDGNPRGVFNGSGDFFVGANFTNTQGTKLVVKGGTGNVWNYGPDNSGGATFYVITSTGTGVGLTAGNTSWSAISDERLKNIKAPLTNAVDKLSTLRTVYGNYKTDENTVNRLFLIAQDVQKVYPEAVDVGTDENQTLSLRVTDLIPTLVAAIQELKAEVDSLKQQLGK